MQQTTRVHEMARPAPANLSGALQSMRAFWVSTYLADVRTVTVAPEKAQARRGFAVAGNVCFVWGG